MAELEAWRKYPAEGEVVQADEQTSYRLDHPSFQNVHRTTFAKGVITDVEKVTDDPMDVKSMVKVKIEGYEESDFIPIFYHPKKQYWDDDEHQAIDYDAENKYFHKAWMSYRIGDEAVVLMQAAKDSKKLVAKFVVGFVDDYPRLGEMLARFDYDGIAGGHYFFYMLHFLSVFGDYHYYGDLYRDGESSFNVEQTGIGDDPLYLTVEKPITQTLSEIVITERWVASGSALTQWAVCYETYDYYKRYYEVDNYYTNILEYKVGPVTYKLEIESYDYIETVTYQLYGFLGTFPDNLPNYGNFNGGNPMSVGYDEYCDCPCSLSVRCIGLTVPFGTAIPCGAGTGSVEYSENDVITSINVYAKTKESDEYVKQTALTSFMNLWLQWEDQPDIGSIIVKTRPHTKEELIDAGLLRKDGTLPEPEE